MYLYLIVLQIKGDILLQFSNVRKKCTNVLLEGKVNRSMNKCQKFCRRMIDYCHKDHLVY